MLRLRIKWAALFRTAILNVYFKPEMRAFSLQHVVGARKMVRVIWKWGLRSVF